jgi:hypothetical protein
MVEWPRLIVNDSQIMVDDFRKFDVFNQKARQSWLCKN